jgi:carbonic anhydrase
LERFEDRLLVNEKDRRPITDALLRNNERYAQAFHDGGRPLRPGKRLAVVTCMDSRMHVDKILGLEVGDAHIIRNAGGVVTDDTIRSLAISQRLLGTEEIIIILHTDCGLLAFKEDELKDRIQAETGVRPGFSFHAFTDIDAEVLASIARIHASPFLSAKDHVRGFVYDVKTGRLREVKASGGATS